MPEYRIYFSEDPFFQQPAFIPLIEETHGGEDVGIWADGPGARLFTGTIENTFIAHAIACVLCLNDRMCKYCEHDITADIITGVSYKFSLSFQYLF